jgi:hypothetical protein
VLVYVGFFLLIFVVINLFFILQVSQDIRQRQYALAEAVGGQVADDMQLALQAGPGFNATFILPPKINGQPYVVQFYKSSIYVIVESAPVPGLSGGGYDSRFFYPLGTSNVVFSPNCPIANCTEVTYGAAIYHQYNMTAADGKMRVQNVMVNGYPQLQILPVK